MLRRSWEIGQNCKMPIVGSGPDYTIVERKQRPIETAIVPKFSYLLCLVLTEGVAGINHFKRLCPFHE